MKRSKLKLIALALSFFLIQQVHSLNPSRTYTSHPDKMGMNFKEHKVKTKDLNAQLNVWEFPCSGDSNAEWVIFFHNGEGNMGEYLDRVKLFQKDFNVLTFDYRGFGESSEFDINKMTYIYPHFQDDVETMIDFCRKNYAEQFSLYGWGIGGGLALGMGYYRHEINWIIADTPFLSMEDLDEKYYNGDFTLDVPFAGFDKRNEPIFSLEGSVGKNLKGVKLIVGSNEKILPVKDMNKLKAKSDLVHDIYVVENPDNIDNFQISQTDYYNVVSSFLKN